eukprot:TRINITY_DN64318_c0_g1_i1.p1 TRINITY_DN64318_c0_g1~~TRINITY_DN64318_c0_g1_i1.p1  ORF type:complete len:377 (+),score=62.66 TRINITY_DN64318_c0_g1_i1:72-1202(+)
MCRWIIFAARKPIGIADIAVHPQNSLIKQSFDARWHPGFTDQNNAVLNGDGTGFGWYVEDKPYLYKSVVPAWSDLNLLEISSCTTSPLVFGHVRAASPGSVVNRECCHPFRFGRLLFLHNGHIEDFQVIKRKMLESMTDEALLNIKGVTDSEHAFAMLVSKLKAASRDTEFQPEELESAMKQMIEQVLQLLKDAHVDHGFTSLNFALTDGKTVVATRFCDQYPKVRPPSLYFCYERRSDLDLALSKVQQGSGPGDGSELGAGSERAVPGHLAHLLDDMYTVTDKRWQEADRAIDTASKDPALRALMVASEPTTMDPAITWHALPANSMLTYTRGSEDAAQRSRPVLQHLVCGNAIPLVNGELTDVTGSRPKIRRVG